MHASLQKAMTDDSPHVRIAAAEALGRYGSEEDVKTALDLLVALGDGAKSNSYVAIHALNAIDAIGKKATPWKQQIAALETFDPKSPARVNREYTSKLVKWLKTEL